MKVNTAFRSLFSGLAVASLILFPGCSHSRDYLTSCGTPPAPVREYCPVEPAPEPCAAPVVSCYDDSDCGSRAETEQYILEKSCPSEGCLGDDVEYKITFTAKCDLINVCVTDMLPEGKATFVSADPMGEMSANKIKWHYDRVAAGEVLEMCVIVKPEACGSIRNCAMVECLPFCCVSTEIGQPILTITKCGPECAEVGDCITFDVTISNDGDFVARNVVLKDNVPSGLRHASGSDVLCMDVGDLCPGDSRSFSITFEVCERGRHCNVATVEGNNCCVESAQACVNVVQPGLDVSKTGPEEQFVNKVATYEIVVRNTGDVDLTDVQVTDTFDNGLDFVSADGAECFGNSVRWTIDCLGAGESMTFIVELTARCPGKFCDHVTVTAACEELCAQDDACTCWKGYAALCLEVCDSCDPLLVGEETTYNIRITNQGTAADTNVSISATFPEELEPVRASGPTKNTATEKTVSFAPIDSLRPGQQVEYRIVGKAVSVGDARLEVELNSDYLDGPVTEQESTHVY